MEESNGGMIMNYDILNPLQTLISISGFLSLIRLLFIKLNDRYNKRNYRAKRVKEHGEKEDIPCITNNERS